MRWIAVALAGFGAIELMPNVPLYTRTARANHSEMNAMEKSADAEVRAMTIRGEHAFLLNYDATHNDFLANYLAASAGVRAYNAGGDKNATLSVTHWPEAIKPLSAPTVTGDDVARAFLSHRVDVVVAPFVTYDGRRMRGRPRQRTKRAQQKRSLRCSLIPASVSIGANGLPPSVRPSEVTRASGCGT